MILEAVKKALAGLISKQGYKHENFAIVTGIGCHAKIYDYLNVNGIYGLHGRVIPTAEGIKLGNGKLNVLGFAGDGDTYAEGMGHFIHAFRHNIDMTLIVHDNQSFSLTTGQPTPTSQKGYISKACPAGNPEEPINPVKIALASGATFIARANPADITGTSEILEKAIKHKGFSFVEIMQKCLIFNKDMNSLEPLMYIIKDNYDKKKAEILADKWDYNSGKTGKDKIPIGVIYQKK
jgi:2-oxoglutarate ferredoxin oxidoreductase subunit beta